MSLAASILRRGRAGEVIESFTVECHGEPIGAAVVLATTRGIVAVMDVMQLGRLRSVKRSGFETSCAARSWLVEAADRVPCGR